MDYDISEKISHSRGRWADRAAAIITLIILILSIVRVPYVGSPIDDYIFKITFGIGRYLIYPILFYFCIMRIIDRKSHEFVNKRSRNALLFFIGFITMIGMIEGTTWINSKEATNFGTIMSNFWTIFHTSDFTQHDSFGGVASGFLGIFYFGLLHFIPNPWGLMIGYIMSIYVAIIGLSLVITFKKFYLYSWIIQTIKYNNAIRKEKQKQIQLAHEAKQKYPFAEQTGQFSIDEKTLEKEVKADFGLDRPNIDKFTQEFTDPYSNLTRNIPKKEKRSFSIFKKKEEKVVDEKQESFDSQSMIRPYGVGTKVNNFQEAYNNIDLSNLDYEKVSTIGQNDVVIDDENSEYDVSIQSKGDLINLDYQSIDIEELSDVQKDLSHEEELKSHIERQKAKLIELFNQFDIEIEIVSQVVGATVIRYDMIVKNSGIKVSRVLQMHDDIQLTLACRNVMIYAPVPNKSIIGIEVDNPFRRVVSFKEIYKKAVVNDLLDIPLGEDFNGEAISLKLESAPHVLVAGATGSGKSICINTIISSIIMRCKPSDVRLLLIDPKRVELSVFSKLPPLLCPVITDTKKAALALKKLIEEMEQRFTIFSEAGARNIDGYNNKVDTNRRLPKIVVVIDELADLILSTGKDIEESITRLTQLARAAGIHIIVATQRPSVDVITGLIKSNIPTRISFAVSTAIDSRTIIDQGGAEKLLGKGDMLFLSYGATESKRVQGSYVSDEDLNFIVTQTKNNHSSELIFNEKFLNLDEELRTSSMDVGYSDGASDQLYEQCLTYVRVVRKASTSLLQRRFGIGFTRAARIIDAMEANGIVGPSQGSKPRDVLN
ncbi:hypothetical protein ASO20_02750 [Mycoplasma sp. (ex Biomphalaria glabrata)]|uniref:DNA translocase FtsK n=1 Tax=Mycoplasma sp. (ex Biomphalaria glabrata) TaxID=1749074 RepID=UPI00073A8C19|nr:DNA translocase FtsK [Mycoplasma sp. (ex Biomphalaria glabrata)]ALV23554.1 hypothetical protein ASO20_02750 [Mycoplasma sp. (ex Biomphalaria glabrata)]